MKKKLTLAIAAYVLLVAGILTYIYCPRTVIKNTAMWYEKDFTIPIYCKKVRFEYDKNTGGYIGKFKISGRTSDKLLKKLDNAFDRSRIGDYKALSYQNITVYPYELNATVVEDKAMRSLIYYYEEEKTEMDTDKIFEEDWMMEAGAELLAYYIIYPRYIEGATKYQKPENGEIPKSYIVIYKNTDNEYYFCIKHTDY